MNNRYEIREPIGKGGLGAVYKAFDTQLQRDVAIKRILSTKHATEEEVQSAGEKLLAEAQTLSSLNHPNIVTVFDVGQDDEGGFVVMELLNGETLDETVERGVLTQEDFTEVVIQSLEALIAAQALNVLHRDLKPPNVMVIWQPSGKFQTKILDFGLAKFSKSPSVQTMDQDDAVMGSIFFMAPEQFERAELDYCTDMYQIGCVYYHALTGQYPFRGETAPQVMNAHLQHRVTPLEKLRPDLSPSICQWVMWLINREMANRPASAKQALDAYPKNPEAPQAAKVAEVVVEPARTGSSTVKIVSAPTHDAAPPTGAILTPVTNTTGVSPMIKRPAGLATGPLRQGTATGVLQGNTTGQVAGSETGGVPVAKFSETGETGIPVQPPKSRKTLWTLLIITLISIVSAIGFVVVSKKKAAAEAARFLELSKMEEVTGTGKDVALALRTMLKPDALPAEKVDARKILIGFRGPEADTQVIEALNETNDSSQFIPLTYILGERGTTKAFPAMLRSFKRIPDGQKAESRRIRILGTIRQVANQDAVPEMMKELAKDHPPSVRRVMEDIILAVLRQEGNSSGVTAPLLSRATQTTSGDERQSLFRILGLLGGEDVEKRLRVVFQKQNGDLDYQRNAMIGLMSWQNHSVLPLIEKIATTTKDTPLKLIALRAYLRVVSLPAPISAKDRVALWEKAIDLSKDDFKRVSSDLRMLFTTAMDYSDPETEAFLKKMSQKEVIGGLAKGALDVLQKKKSEFTTINKSGELVAADVGVRGDGRAGRDLFEGAIGGWISPETWFSWHIRVTEGGDYKVEVDQSTPLKGSSEFMIFVNEQKLTGLSQTTDSFSEYKAVQLDGQLKLEAGKNYTLLLRAGSQVQPRMMNIKAVRLTKK